MMDPPSTASEGQEGLGGPSEGQDDPAAGRPADALPRAWGAARLRLAWSYTRVSREDVSPAAVERAAAPTVIAGLRFYH
ncbi:MAG: hypothetical protein R3B09_06275 [Nannocystaceae bacterium]